MKSRKRPTRSTRLIIVTILITGAYGFVDANLCRYLIDKGHTCLALDIPNAKRDDVAYSEFRTGDELDSIDFSKINTIAHLADKAHDLKNVSNSQSYFDINVGLTERIFNASAGRRAQAVRGLSRIHLPALVRSKWLYRRSSGGRGRGRGGLRTGADERDAHTFEESL